MRIETSMAVSTSHQKLTQEAANGLERAFLSEMLKYAGPKPSEGDFSGGVGESQFGSMLTDAYADALASRIDLGLAKKPGVKP
ncbi:rod-binding protein [Paracoccus lutimaris]|uniref:Rod binding protein n=1 Tax=Paracoccus lutimaris TaxID=1490030 RepID=A0A368YKK1_9RHOB|nr:rod-binding protein [Paracoccus lutimaris]RCW80762.1 rod binding protein [Paracoccus lutimaris]